MTEGFRAVPSSDSILLPAVSSTFTAPINIATPDVSVFSSLELAFIYSGAASGNPQEFCQVQLLWRDSAGTICWVDTVEFSSANVSGFSSSTPAYIQTPVRGTTLQLVSTNSGPGVPGTPQLAVRVYGSYRPVPNFIAWQDALSFRSTDLLAIGISGGALAPGASATIVTAGLASGPCMFSCNVAQAVGGTTTRFRFSFGSTGLGWADQTVPTLGGGGGTASLQVTSLLLPRRPVGILVTNTGATNNVNSYNFIILRDEP